MMKKKLALVLAMAMTASLALTGCGNGSDSGSGSGSGADSSAVGRKTSDGGFLVNGSQVGKGEGPVKLLLAAA